MKSCLSNGIAIYAPQSRSELIDYAILNHKILVAINAEKILHASEESRSIINRNLGYPDGIGAVWALRKKGVKNAIKIPGCELWLDIIARHYQTKTFYLIGGSDQVIQNTVKKLRNDFQNIKITNHRNGFIKTQEEKNLLIADILNKKPDIIFVAMGSPKQELLMEEIQKEHQATYQGLGGSFDVFTGKVSRAPQWWINNNLEWAYRLIDQPTRIKRQIHLGRFLVLLHFNKL